MKGSWSLLSHLPFMIFCPKYWWSPCSRMKRTGGSATVQFCDHLSLPLTVIHLVFLKIYLSLWCRCSTFAAVMVIWRPWTALTNLCQTAPLHRHACMHAAPVQQCVQKTFRTFQTEQHTPLLVYLQWFYPVSWDITPVLKQWWIGGKLPKQFCIFSCFHLFLWTHKCFQLNYNFITTRISL